MIRAFMLFLAIQIASAAQATGLGDLANYISLSQRGKDVFYASSPEIVADRNALHSLCRHGEHEDDNHSQLMGCYLQGERKIYVLQTTEARVKDLMTSVTAHELLHAVYALLNPSEKYQIQILIDQVWQGPSKELLQDLTSTYDFTSKEQWYNEMHSFIGTEIDALPLELEQHYANYFLNRQELVRKSRNVETQIAKLKEQIQLYDQEILQLKSDLERRLISLDKIKVQIQDLKSQLADLEKRGQISKYNELVNTINGKIEILKRDNDSRNKLIEDFNALILKRNQLASEITSLVNSMKSK